MSYSTNVPGVHSMFDEEKDQTAEEPDENVVGSQSEGADMADDLFADSNATTQDHNTNEGELDSLGGEPGSEENGEESMASSEGAVSGEPDSTGDSKHILADLAAGELGSKEPVAEEKLSEADQRELDLKQFAFRLDSLLWSREALKMQWVDYQFNKAYYDCWQSEANEIFRKEVLMRSRLKKLK